MQWVCSREKAKKQKSNVEVRLTIRNAACSHSPADLLPHKIADRTTRTSRIDLNTEGGEKNFPVPSVHSRLAFVNRQRPCYPQRPEHDRYGEGVRSKLRTHSVLANQRFHTLALRCGTVSFHRGLVHSTSSNNASVLRIMSTHIAPFRSAALIRCLLYRGWLPANELHGTVLLAGGCGA